MATRNTEESPNQEEEKEEEEGSPQNKRPKTQTPNRPSPTKGKKKMEEEDACGICLCEEGKAMRGYIDSCDHYFCFVCIMEWAKVESRCPLCKRRFAAIRRPVKDGVFAVERVVNVPLRDQVCHNYGNATAGPPDPYSEVKCTVCLNTSNDSLLLLCELCDSASHTYCVGLGTTVPEGDWFCQDCTLLRDEHSKDDQVPDYDSEFGSKPSPNYVNQSQSEEFSQIPSAETHVSIFDIIREPKLRDGHESSPNRSHMLSIVPEKRESRLDTVTDNGSVENFFFRRGASQLGARTLGHCRSVHGHIRALRENWNGLRQGSFSFPSISNQRGVSLEQHRKSGQSNSSSFLSQQSTPRIGSPSKMLPNSGSEDIDKAWKMMNVAKSIEKLRRKPNTVHRVSKGSENPLRKVNTLKQKVSGSSKILTSYIGNKDHIRKFNQYSASVKTNDWNKYHMFEGEKPHGLRRSPEGSSASHSIVFSELSSSIVVQDSLEVGICNGKNSGDLLQNEVLGTLPNVINERDEGNILLYVSENNYCAKEKLHASSSSNLKGKHKVKKDCFEYKSKKDDDAKCEIQSLVKLNLKLLSKDKNLEAVVFKEVARLATHSILAACGIGHPKPGVRSFPSSVCSHGDDNQHVRRSTLMPNSCRECFFVFVKDVVNSIMLEKLS